VVPGPIWEATRAVTIDASAAQVWPWVAQMGYGRGGWYGWNPLEREDTGVSELLAGLPPPTVGDVWLDGPGCDETRGAWKVAAIEPPRTLALRTVRDPVTGRELDPAAKPRLVIDSAWVFHLEEIAAGRTRLLARTRIRMQPGWALLALKWMGAGDTVMQPYPTTTTSASSSQAPVSSDIRILPICFSARRGLRTPPSVGRLRRCWKGLWSRAVRPPDPFVNL
jgi:hypothetical protein